MFYIDRYLSRYLRGCRKGNCTQQTLNSMIKKWRKTIDKKEYTGPGLMDLSNACDKINR